MVGIGEAFEALGRIGIAIILGLALIIAYLAFKPLVAVKHPPTAIKHEVWQLNKRGKMYFYVDHATRLAVEDCVKHPDGCIVAEQLDEPAEVIVGGKK
jgi:hypothetical protein